MRSYLDFEKPVAELDSKVDELRTLAASGTDISEEIGKIGSARRKQSCKGGRWQRVSGERRTPIAVLRRVGT